MANEVQKAQFALMAALNPEQFIEMAVQQGFTPQELQKAVQTPMPLSSLPPTPGNTYEPGPGPMSDPSMALQARGTIPQMGAPPTGQLPPRTQPPPNLPGASVAIPGMEGLPVGAMGAAPPPVPMPTPQMATPPVPQGPSAQLQALMGIGPQMGAPPPPVAMPPAAPTMPAPPQGLVTEPGTMAGFEPPPEPSSFSLGVNTVDPNTRTGMPDFMSWIPPNRYAAGNVPPAAPATPGVNTTQFDLMTGGGVPAPAPAGTPTIAPPPPPPPPVPPVSQGTEKVPVTKPVGVETAEATKASAEAGTTEEEKRKSTLDALGAVGRSMGRSGGSSSGGRAGPGGAGVGRGAIDQGEIAKLIMGMLRPAAYTPGFIPYGKLF